MNHEEKPLGLWGWIKARFLTWKLRRRYRRDPEFRERLQKSVEAAIHTELEKRKTIKVK